MVDRYFYWFTMGHTCGEIWAAIRRAFERGDTWDRTSFVMPDGSPKPAIEPTIDILLRDPQYPSFLDTTYHMTGAAFLDKDNPESKGKTGLEPDNCILAIGKYNRVAATALEAHGPLSLRKLYKSWPARDWKPK
jgi:hypothetical protein